MQQQVDSGKLPARTAYEVSKLPDDESRRALAAKVSSGGLTNRETAQEVQRHQARRRPKRKPGGTKLDFISENGWKITISSKRKGNYYEIEEALQHALEEVQLRIKSGIQIF